MVLLLIVPPAPFDLANDMIIYVVNVDVVGKQVLVVCVCACIHFCNTQNFIITLWGI
jgi:hypothetical protein